MKWILRLGVIAAASIFSVSCSRHLASTTPPPVATAQTQEPEIQKATKAYEPSYQSSEYRAIQAAFVDKLKNTFPAYPAPRRDKVEFDMGYLRVQADWAFAHAHLGYKAETSQKPYLYPAALLQRSDKKKWRVVAITDTNFNWDSKDGRSQSDVGVPPIVGEKTWIKEMESIQRKWSRQFTTVPQSIFPNPNDMYTQDLGNSQLF